jgi:hypothetical protein
MAGEIGTLDTLPGYSSNFTSFLSDNEYFGLNLYSEIGSNGLEFSTESNNINIDDLKNWKNTKRHDIKLSQDDIKSYLDKRRQEENLIFNEIENNLQNNLKKKEVEKFLMTKHLSENIDEYYNNNQNKNDEKSVEVTTTVVVTSSNSKPDEENVLDYMDRINNEEKTVFNVRKREFK